MRAKGRAIATVTIGGLSLAGFVWTAIASQTACQLQGTCDQSSAWFPGPAPTAGFPNAATATLPNSGVIDDGLTWQSNGSDDPWLFFPGGRTYVIYPLIGGPGSPRFFGPDWDFETFVATDPQPTTTGNFTVASGNLAEIFLVTDPSPGQFAVESAADAAAPPPVFNVVNATCADYYLRILVHRHPSDAGVAPILDAASDAPSAADASDAAVDARSTADASDAGVD